MSKKLLKQVVGIDVAQQKIDVCLGVMDEHTEIEICAYNTFNNNQKGHLTFVQWVKKHTQADVSLKLVMEATGVYHERLAYFLTDNLLNVSIVMPNKITNFFRTLEIKTVTDKSMSFAIAMFGLEKKMDTWQPPNKAYRQLRQLTREREQLVMERTVAKNQLHAEQVEAYPHDKAIARVLDRINLLDQQIAEVVSDIKKVSEKDEEVKNSIKLMSTIPGIGLLTAAHILGETDGFALIRNKKQLTSYAGLDVKEKESGTSIKGKPRISKRGNKYLRKAMHLPALAAVKCNDHYKAIYARIVAKTGVKMKAAVAIQRKLLELTFTLYKNKKEFDINYFESLQKRVATE